MRNFAPALVFALSLIAAAGDSQSIPAQQWQQAAQLAQAQHPREALAMFKSLLQESTDQNMVRSAAAVLRQSGAPKETELLLQWAGERAKGKAAFAPDLADLYQSQLRYADAVHQLALALENGAANAAAGIEAIAVQTGYDKAAAWLEREPLRRDESLRLRGDLWSRAGDIPRAWASYRTVASPQLAAALLDGLLQSDLPPEQATGFIEQYLQRRPADRGRWELRLAACLAAAGEYARAQQLLNVLAGQGVRPAQFALAQLLLEQRHSPAESRQVIERYARAWPEPLHTDGQFLIASALNAAGQPDSALSILAPLADTGRGVPARQQAYFQMAEIEFARQNFDRAVELYGQVTKLGPSGDLVNDALSQLLLISENKTDRMSQLRTWSGGRAAETRLDLKAAADSYAVLAAGPPGDALGDRARLRLAELAEQQRDYREAARRFQQLGQAATDTLLAAEALYRCGRIRLQRLGDGQQARAAWEQGILKFPDTSWADLMRGELERLQPKRRE